MSKHRFAITHPNHNRIEIEADDGIIVDDWNDLTAPSCLLIPNGRFKIEPNRTVFTSDGNTNFIFDGKPFGGDKAGAATIELTENGCSNDGWSWKALP